MSDIVQTLVIALVVVAAAAYVGRRAWRALRPKAKAGCASDCGCGPESASSGDWAKS